MRAALVVLTLCLTLSSAGAQSFDGDDVDLDLPIEPPVLIDSSTVIVPKPSGADPVQPPDAEDDPRDEPPPVFFGEEIDSENCTIVYVLDTSGSMSRNDRLTHAKRELTRSIEGLSPVFQFNFIHYSCSLRRFFPAMVEANESNKAAVLGYIAGLGDSGGTGTGPAMAMALADKEVQAVVLLTDGGPNCGAQSYEGHRAMIRNSNTQGATINVFGIDADGHLRLFCMNVAADSGGAYFDVSIPSAKR